MGLLDEIKGEPRRYPAQCAIRTLLEQLPPDEGAELKAAVEDLTIQASVIVRVLQRRGHDIKAGSLTRHRRRECVCNERV